MRFLKSPLLGGVALAMVATVPNAALAHDGPIPKNYSGALNTKVAYDHGYQNGIRDAGGHYNSAWMDGYIDGSGGITPGPVEVDVSSGSGSWTKFWLGDIQIPEAAK